MAFVLANKSAVIEYDVDTKEFTTVPSTGTSDLPSTCMVYWRPVALATTPSWLTKELEPVKAALKGKIGRAHV